MRVSSAVYILVLQVFISSYCVVAYYDDDLIRQTHYGRVQGASTTLSQVYLGIRFAAPAERWTPPVDPVPWSGIVDATQLKPMCYQSSDCTGPFPINCVPQKSEDCLYMNIYAPLGTTRKSRKAVMVWIHGGSFTTGSAGGLVYNAEMLANKGDVIVVTFNYRLGALGFLVTGSTSNDITGNYGIMDQSQALKWVNENIQYFGGNRFKVTLFGQSAGATSAAIQLMSGKVDRYFHRVILQSTPFTIPLKPSDQAIEQGRKFGLFANCLNADSSVNVACLRSLPADVIIELQGNPLLRVFTDSGFRAFFPWIPSIDGGLIKSGIIEGLLTRNFGEKQIIIGTVREEGLPYIMPAFTDPLDADILQATVFSFVPNVAVVGSDLFNLYPPSDISDTRDVLSDMTTDYVFACPARKIARELSSRTSVYSYVFDEALAIYPLLFPNFPYCTGVSCHSTDIPFVFQSARIPPLEFDAAELDLSNKMIEYWSGFAWFGNVNRKYSVPTEWVKYSADVSIYLQAPVISTLVGYRSDVCDQWDIVGYE